MFLAFVLFFVGSSAERRALVIGGSGRVGGSAVRALLKRGIDVNVGGRDERNWKQYLKRVSPLESEALKEKVTFHQLDLFDDVARPSLVRNYDLVINTAGPFQGLSSPVLLEDCLRQGVRYVDVCDDMSLSRVALSPKYQALAKETCTSAVISAGIWPGVSSILAQNLLSQITDTGATPQRVRFNFFTAGSGGAGETILTATFLLLGENVLTYVDGRPVMRKTATDAIEKDFGVEIGKRQLVRLNLIECESCFKHHRLRLPNLSVETRFGTAPRFWNLLFQGMALAMPQSLLQDRAAMRLLALISLPMVRVVDSFVGSRNGIQIEVDATWGKSTDSDSITSTSTSTALLTHSDLENEVGCCLADFAVQLLNYKGAPGVFFPEDIPSDIARQEILKDSISRALTFKMTVIPSSQREP